MSIQELANYHKALADPVRLLLLACLIHRDEVCVCDLVTATAARQSLVSRHLAYLKRYQLVKSERRGTWQYYSHKLNAQQLATLTATMQGVSEVQQVCERLDALSRCC